jgi:hypothetical protein
LAIRLKPTLALAGANEIGATGAPLISRIVARMIAPASTCVAAVPEPAKVNMPPSEKLIKGMPGAFGPDVTV